MRRHAHAVWSRIDADEMKAVQMSHSHHKLMDVSRELYLEHDWKMPRGMANQNHRDPLNFTVEEWQQSKRAGHDAREIKAAMQDAWATSDSKTAFTNALQERGFWLAKGDRRGYVAVDHQGEVYSLSRYTGVKTKQLRERLGEEEKLSSVDDTSKRMADAMARKMGSFGQELEAGKQAEQQRYETQRMALVEHQRAERQALTTAQAHREVQEHQDRQAKLRKGVLGLWDRLTGTRKQTLEANAREADLARQRDQAERDRQIFGQIQKRREMIETRKAEQDAHRAKVHEISTDAARYREMSGVEPPSPDASVERDARRQAFDEARQPAVQPVSEKGPTLDR